jgi:hypothetical protein
MTRKAYSSTTDNLRSREFECSDASGVTVNTRLVYCSTGLFSEAAGTRNGDTLRLR